MCIVTGFGGISEDPLDFRVCVGHENGPEWRGGTHCLFAGGNVYFIYIYLCVCVMSWTLEILVGGVVEVPRALVAVVIATSGESEWRVRWWVIEV